MSKRDSDLATLFGMRGGKALVAGGATGIGQACAFALAKAGADVAIADINAAAAERSVAAIRSSGRDTMYVRCDVTREVEVAGMVDSVAKRFGRIDIAVNNAGIYRQGEDASYSFEDWKQVIDLNLTGVWLCARAEMQQMSRQAPGGGKIINIASIASVIAVSNGSYDASKAGVAHLTRTLAARWGVYNINVNCISPGYVGIAFGKSRPEDMRAHLRSVTPMGYVQRLQDLAGAIIFLASSASDFVTGQNLVVDGGHTLSTWLKPLERKVPPRIDPAAEQAELTIENPW